MAEYIAAVFEEAGGFGIVFPDFPGCVTQGANLDEAHTMAREALDLHLEGLLEDGEPVPRPMGLATAKGHELCAGADAFIFVRASQPQRSVRVNITLPENALARIDAYAKAHGYTRSSLLLKGACEIVERDDGCAVFRE